MDASLAVFCLEYTWINRVAPTHDFNAIIVSAELRKHCALNSCLGDFKAVGSLYRVSEQVYAFVL